MNESDTLSYYEKLAEILDPRWRSDVRIGEFLNLESYIDLDKLGTIKYHSYRSMLSHLREYDRAVVELARWRSQNSNEKLQRELRELDNQMIDLNKGKTELQLQKKELEDEINWYKSNLASN